MRVLIVGAGAVGQVYGRHLARAGTDLSFLVKPKYADAVRQGFAMADLNRGGGVERFDSFGVFTDLDAVAESTWDQLWLCISSPALRGDWLEPTLAAVGDATVVSFQPGLRDQGLLTRYVAHERLIKGLISFSSWHAPLPGGVATEPHTAYWSPPLSPSIFQGGGAAECASALVRGGLPAKVGPALYRTARGSALLLPCVAAMECGGWSFAGLRARPWAGLAASASVQALAISCAYLEIPKGPAGVLLNPLAVRLASRLAPVVAPFDIESFLGVHFRKVGEQTAQALDTWVAEGEERGMPTDKLRELRQCLLEARGQASAASAAQFSRGD